MSCKSVCVLHTLGLGLKKKVKKIKVKRVWIFLVFTIGEHNICFVLNLMKAMHILKSETMWFRRLGDTTPKLVNWSLYCIPYPNQM